MDRFICDMYRKLLVFAMFAGGTCACGGPNPEQTIQLTVSSHTIEVGSDFLATITIGPVNGKVCFHTSPMEGISLGFFPLNVDPINPLILPKRQSETECVSDGETYSYDITLMLEETDGGLLLTMDGEEYARFPLVEEVNLGVIVYPHYPSNSYDSQDGYTVWPSVRLRLGN